MFSLFKRKDKPKYQDAPFADLSQMLYVMGQDPTYKAELLDPVELDSTVESLEHLDDYLEAVHEDPPDDEDEMMKVVLRAGAYLGQVIREHSPKKYHWLDFAEAAKRNDMVKRLGMSMGTVAVLAASDDDICFPLAKVGKFIENGREDSTKFFAQIAIEEPTGE